MNDPKTTPLGEREPQPWHAADEKPSTGRHGAPVGTHSLTGAAANVGMPVAPKDEDAERGTARDMPADAREPDPLAEPRAPSGDLLGSRHEGGGRGEGTAS